MKTLNFKLELLSDIIINEKAATEGNQKSLDFIPGSNFLGICAGYIYNNKEMEDEYAFKVIHSSKVRFGDAHPYNEKLNVRAAIIPLSIFYDKLKDNDLYLKTKVQKENNLQLKQVRGGFYYFDSTKKAVEVDLKKTFSIKSAYDQEKRATKESQLFGYQSLRKGSIWHFDVTYDTKDLSENAITIISESLIGIKHIGRSRSAEYGLVKISLLETSPALMPIITNKLIQDEVYIYAESRLIFLDQHGLPTFSPTAEQFDFPGYEIDYDKTYIRTFQYAPYNSKRKRRDNDRCGIEKGSVFCLCKKTKISEITISENVRFIGSYQNEGFGKVIINPELLFFADNNGKSSLLIEEDNNENISYDNNHLKDESKNSPLITHLKNKQVDLTREIDAFNLTNKYTKNEQYRFKGEKFASQWGQIRKIAQTSNSKEELYNKLFDKQKGYLMHGVASEEWVKRDRIRSLKKFFDDNVKEDNFKILIVNLSSEMAKTLKRL